MSRRAWLFGVAIALLASVGVFRACKSGAPPPGDVRPSGPPHAKRLDLPGLENLAEVAPGIYRGAQPKGEAYRTLKEKLGVKTVINLRSLTDERKEVLAAGLEPVEVPLVADVRGSRPPSREDVAKFLDVLTDPKRRPVYFHCAFGRDRTGTLCAVYRMEVEGWTNEQAIAEMEEFGFRDLWVDLRDFVEGYKPEGRWRAGSR
jgi:hypothetical protein